MRAFRVASAGKRSSRVMFRDRFPLVALLSDSLGVMCHVRCVVFGRLFSCSLFLFCCVLLSLVVRLPPKTTHRHAQRDSIGANANGTALANTRGRSRTGTPQTPTEEEEPFATPLEKKEKAAPLNLLVCACCLSLAFITLLF